jgi:hypothetical protein
MHEEDQEYKRDIDKISLGDEYLEKTNPGITKLFKNLKEKFLSLEFYLDIFSDIIDKTGKLINWEDKRTSKAFFVFLICVFIVVTLLPIRYFVILGLLMKFSKGKTYYKRRYDSNKEAIKIEISNFMVENKCIDKSEHHENFRHFMIKNPE